MLKSYIHKLLKQQSLERAACRDAVLTMLLQDVAAEQIAAFLALLHAKGETTAEILGAIDALQSQMLIVPVKDKVLDIVGTGGDHSNSLNISTASAILAASCGVKIAKHGNRAVSSQCGSADVLEALAVDIAMSPQQIAAGIAEYNIGFCFAQRFHPVMAKLRDVRRRLGVPTIFNLIGPFLNPARPQHYLIGAFSADLLPKFAEILLAMNLGRSAVVHSMGMDEMSCYGITEMIVVENGEQHHEHINPEALGLALIPQGSLKGGSPDFNAEIISKTLAGEINLLTDTLILNAATALYLYGLSANITDGIEYARSALQAGKAMTLLTQWQSKNSRSTHYA